MRNAQESARLHCIAPLVKVQLSIDVERDYSETDLHGGPLSGGPCAEPGSAEAIVEDMVRTDEEQWEERLRRQDVQQVTQLYLLATQG